MQDLLETLLEENFDIIANARSGLRRDYAFPKADNMIKVVVGMRRSGKTYFLYQTINDLLDSGIVKEQILFINFEDDRLLPMNAKTMGALLDSFYSLYPENHHRPCYIFLDELQNVDDWHLVVRRFFDSKNVQLYLTGSSAKLLSKEINTRLRGRSLSLEMFPYSFQEYLKHHHITTNIKPFGKMSYDMSLQHLINYFTIGGFPAVQDMPKNEWRETLQAYVDTVVLRDIIERYNVTNIALLKYLVKTLLRNAATPFSINKFYNDAKSQGFKAGKDTARQYLDYIQDAFLAFATACYSPSERGMQNKPKKIYANDNSLIQLTSTTSQNLLYGKLLENLVYLDLRRQKKKIYFYQTSEGYEVNFLAIDPEGQHELIQVAWDVSDPKTLAREQRALLAAEKELGIQGHLITAKEYLRHFNDTI